MEFAGEENFSVPRVPTFKNLIGAILVKQWHA